MALIRSIAAVGSMTLLSRVLGFVRDVAVAAALGAGGIADIFFVAFKLPNLFRRLFAEGAFNLAFVPIFAGKLEDNDDALKGARTFANESLSALLISLLVIVAVFEIAMPVAMMVFAPGFVDEPARFQLAVDLARITFPYLLFISLVSLLAGVLNSIGRFWAAAAAPILLNLSLITAVVVAAPYFETPAHALSWGVFWGGVVQLLWLYVHTARAGWRLQLVRPRLSGDVKTLLKRMAPVALGAGIYQINIMVDMIIASLLPAGAISYLFYADRLQQLPLGVIGIAVGTALLPLLSRQLKAGDDATALHSQNRALEFALLLTLPAASALAVVPGEIIAVLFERGAFTAEATAKTAAALAVFAFGLPAYIVVKALAPGFFARGDTATPIKIGVLCLVINVVLNLILMKPFQHVGIAAATVVASWVNAGLMAWVLARRGQFKLDARLVSKVARQVLAAAVMAGVVAALAGRLAPWFGGALGEQVMALVAVVVAGLVTYGLLAVVLGAATWSEIRNAVRR